MVEIPFMGRKLSHVDLADSPMIHGTPYSRKKTQGMPTPHPMSVSLCP
jgi:hypothetical protein